MQKGYSIAVGQVKPDRLCVIGLSNDTRECDEIIEINEMSINSTEGKQEVVEHIKKCIESRRISLKVKRRRRAEEIWDTVEVVDVFTIGANANERVEQILALTNRNSIAERNLGQPNDGRDGAQMRLSAAWSRLTQSLTFHPLDKLEMRRFVQTVKIYEKLVTSFAFEGRQTVGPVVGKSISSEINNFLSRSKASDEGQLTELTRLLRESQVIWVCLAFDEITKLRSLA